MDMHIFRTWDENNVSVLNWTVEHTEEGRQLLIDCLNELSSQLFAYFGVAPEWPLCHELKSAMVRKYPALIIKHTETEDHAKTTLEHMRHIVSTNGSNGAPEIALYLEYYETQKELHYLERVLRGEITPNGNEVSEMRTPLTRSKNPVQRDRSRMREEGTGGAIQGEEE